MKQMNIFGKCVKIALRFVGIVMTTLLMFISSLLCLSVSWAFFTWPDLSMEEIVFHLAAPLEGTNEDMIREYINLCLVPALVIAILVLILFAAWGGVRYYVLIGLGSTIALVSSAIAFYIGWTTLDIGGYMEARGRESDFIEENYIDPRETEITFPEEKRNLVYIFLESMETSFTDKENGGAMKENVIPAFTKLAQSNEDFSGNDRRLNGASTMSGATWTMAAMFAHTSGLPLNIPIEINAMDTQEVFFPGIITLGDILEEQGYSQTLMVGSDATFGGRELYFENHGNYDIIDYEYALESGMLPPGYKEWWGFEDAKLFEFAKEKLLEFAEQEEPFNLTILTVDTHFEGGYKCAACPDEYEEQYSNVLVCSGNLVKDFLDWMKEQSFYEDTAIVLAGDHLTMDTYYANENSAEEGYERKAYVSYINPAKATESNAKRSYTTFDHFPTTLAAMGAEIEGDRLGLGTNLFSDTPTLLERLGYERLNMELKSKSKFMEDVSSIDENSTKLMRRDGRLPSAIVWAEDYDYEQSVIPVYASSVSAVPGEVEAVIGAVWTEEDKSDLLWIPMDKSRNKFGEYYYGYIHVPNFSYHTGEYFMEAYAVNAEGDQYLLGETVVVVDE